ncbi:glycoside hydrolase family 32 protein [Maribacter polysaccharolyticus]|uniref:glycoside hydrolase family 32 protein n=1 Tax=Maribacter polysaccharolyticus TaxID=3020831 RepID=UPI00237F32D4|nr:glycoside hydrolase family 32 protein [Maribacter polysaccharolyticus]MDE3742662.1 glycoside hydrolase family 32 protein [Maribacter polysaccharolyticus]
MKKHRLKLVLAIAGLCIFFACKEHREKDNKGVVVQQESPLDAEEELYRPNYHFTPKVGWMNDPNGMFHYNGYYHLYFQHYPDGNKWGPMHWGHAVSTDMVKWKEQPIALYPDDMGYIFSGSAVVDLQNSSGFGKEGQVPIIAMFTYHNMEIEKAEGIDVESQAIAYSLDEGLTWTKYEGNPVIENPGIRDFRDPKVSWDEEHGKWVMVLAAHDKVMFYGSKDLKKWELMSYFGGDMRKDLGTHGGVWECPDFFQMPVAGTNETKWVLYVSVNPGGPNGGSATQYFIGDFDGTKFSMDKDFETVLNKGQNFWIDFGKDNYAGVTFSNVTSKNGGKFYMGWMSNWEYANEVPTETWRSAMTVAREVKLIKDAETYRLAFDPVDELDAYKGVKYKKERIAVNGLSALLDSEKVNLSRTAISFSISDVKKDSFTFKLSNKQGDELSFGYNGGDNSFFIDRHNSGKTGFSDRFSNKVSKAKRSSDNALLSGTILLDKTSIELFFDEGSTVMTEIFFPNAPFETLSIESASEDFVLDFLEVNELNIN